MAKERKYFGTDGIRGVAGESPLDPETLVRLGKAIASVFLRRKGKHRILIGKDTRLSGYMIETALAAGITSMGADVLLCGPLPTPGVAYLTKSMRADAGVVISASHNPYEDNGIKIFGADGFKLADEIELELESIIDQEKLAQKNAAASDIGKAQRIDDAVGRYTVYLKSCFPRQYSLEGMRIGFDCANGAGYIVAPQTFIELGADVVSRGISPNGRNINAGFGSLYPEVVRKLILENTLDVGIALDGDADRAIIVDGKGNILDGDMILALAAIDALETGRLEKRQIVATVMSNLGLERFLEKHGVSVLRSQVGDRYVLEQMLENNLMLGGEQSGHTIFAEYSTTGDGILTALMLLSHVCRTGRSITELIAGYQKFPQKIVNIPVRSKPAFESLPKISKIIKQKESDLLGKGRILVRYSGTENKARVMVECEDLSSCERHAQEVATVIEQELGTV
jgi:phosphoglucosamine mutase